MFHYAYYIVHQHTNRVRCPTIVLCNFVCCFTKRENAGCVFMYDAEQVWLYKLGFFGKRAFVNMDLKSKLF